MVKILFLFLPPVQLLYIGLAATTFKGTQPSEAMSTGATRFSMTTYHEYSYIEVRKSPWYGTCKDSYIEGSTTSYDASRYRYGTGSST